MNQNLTGTRGSYIIVLMEGGIAFPVYLYEIDARKADSIETATHLSDVEAAKNMAETLTSMATLQGLNQTFEVRQVETTLTEV